MEPGEVSSGICFLVGPRGVWVTADSMAGLRIQPFPSCFPSLLRKEDREEGLWELELGLNDGKLRKNGNSGKEISAKQEKLLFPSTSKRTSNSVLFSVLASCAGPRQGLPVPKESKLTCLYRFRGDPPCLRLSFSLPNDPSEWPPSSLQLQYALN